MNIKEIVEQIESTMKTSGDNYMKELILTNRKKLRNTFCDECNSYSVFMIVHDELWNIISDGNLDIFLCPKCMENRLGRKIEIADLKICNVNYPYFLALQMIEK
ncbi:hypothetical protein FDG95_gp521 [Pectobacterium phage vB_PcaM_CBB]|uniref:Uncharacterized protein n=1 Tax=Pectobacterium phage vB_PcaM_CBB TaxID=2772511 RepID=A0A1L2CVG9_9CAUD|nr:hypothetical protein FDG95_gp521 [Pectobacterium phage vB_PcaM_CBB]AMM44021.1 hypothetical protein CBB_458 [Pectobacterium phage vB_PcaM_CBB]